MLERVLEDEVMDTVEASAEYDAMDHSAANEAFVERLVELGATGLMLDIGTGPGHMPILVCRRIADATVMGVDLAREMLAIARRNKQASEFDDARIKFELADAKDLQFEDGAFQCVFSNTIVHHIPDPTPMLAEAWRVLHPGGVLLIRDLLRPNTVERLDALVAEHTAEATEHQRRMFRESLHAALTPDEFRAMARAAGIPDTVELVIDTDRHMSLQGRKPA